MPLLEKTFRNSLKRKTAKESGPSLFCSVVRDEAVRARA